MTLFYLIRALLRSRRQAVQAGELRRMWPGAAWDVVTVIWWRGIFWPIHDFFWPPPRDPAEAHPDCPLCNPRETPDA